ncbi:DMT family transporter [Desertimonas flava]|uniref:DMT family transporter n=1 Tax=Desertimonas flava TaxID=2064846 RepID=UPI000E343E6D|nr:DMT family transporter [Desertimonas flava]
MDTAGARRGVLRCLVAALFFGASAPAASRLATDMSAFSLAGLLYLGAAIGALPMLGRTPPSPTAMRRSAVRLSLAVVFGGALGPVLLAAGLTRTPAATSSLLLNLELVATVILAALVFGEHLGRGVPVGTLLVVAAGVILGWRGDADFRWGALLIAGACCCWAIDNCVTAGLDELAPAHITLVKGVAAGTANLLIGIVLGGAPSGLPIIGALVVGVVGYGVSITLWVAGARDLGAARGQLVFATAPFLGAIVAWTVFADPVDAREVASIVVAAAGVSFVLRSDHSHEHRHSAVEHDHEHGHDDGHHDHRHDHGEFVEPGGRHVHRHQHGELVHAHAHVPDLHHRHDHASELGS